MAMAGCKMMPLRLWALGASGTFDRRHGRLGRCCGYLRQPSMVAPPEVGNPLAKVASDGTSPGGDGRKSKRCFSGFKKGRRKPMAPFFNAIN